MAAALVASLTIFLLRHTCQGRQDIMSKDVKLKLMVSKNEQEKQSKKEGGVNTTHELVFRILGGLF